VCTFLGTGAQVEVGAVGWDRGWEVEHSVKITKVGSDLAWSPLLRTAWT
jgi:hypothetical protein